MSKLPLSGAGPSAGGFTPADVPQAEADALIALYNATNGGSWTDNTNWLSAPNVGDWFGITVAGGHVTTIDLRENNLTGDASNVDLSPFATYLTYIRFAHNNSMAGAFSIFSPLAAVTYLDVGPTGGGFTGGFADLSGCTSLLDLDLQGCVGLTGNPTSIGNFANLNKFDLCSAELDSGFSMSDLATITDPNNYIDLRLDTYHILTGDLSDLPQWANLKIFRMHRQNKTTVSQATNLGAWVAIRSIEIDRNGWSQAEVDQILADIYAARADFTYAAPWLNIRSQDAEASGTYQYAANPSTGKEYIYALANDDDSEGFQTWSITYSEGGEDTTVP